MATRFRLTPAGPPSVEPAYAAGWESSANARRCRLGLDVRDEWSIFGGPLASSFLTTDTANQDYCHYMFVSDPISGAGTLSGTIKGIIMTSEVALTNNMCAQLILRVVSGDGATVRGTAYDFDVSALSNEYTTTPTNRGFPRGSSGAAKTLTNVSYSDGDRLVLEVGTRQTAATDADATSMYLENDGTDLVENETGTTQNSPWVELSADLTFVAEAWPVYQGCGAIATTVTDGGTIVPALPVGWAANDIVFCLVMTNDNNAPTISAGWTEVTEFTQANAAISGKLWYRRMVGGDVAPTVTDGGTTALSATNGMFGRCYGYRDCITSGTPYEVPVAAGDTAGTDTTPATAAVTTTAANRLVLSLFAVDDDTNWSSGTGTYPFPAAWYPAGAQTTSTAGADARLGVIGQIKKTAGAVAAIDIGTLAAGESWRSVTLALIPPSAAAAADDPFPYVGAGYYPAAA